eukprot:Em0010g412a
MNYNNGNKCACIGLKSPSLQLSIGLVTLVAAVGYGNGIHGLARPEISVENFEDSWTTFEFTVAANKWDNGRDLVILPALLRGKLQDFYTTLNNDKTKDLAALMSVLSDRASLTKDPLASAKRFTEKKQDANKSARYFKADLRKLFKNKDMVSTWVKKFKLTALKVRDCIEDEPMDTIVNEIEPQGPNQQTSTHIIMPEQLLKDISEASNEYAKRAMTTEKYEKWNKISTAELKAYLGFHILMSINRLPSIDDYWSMNANLRYAPVADRISRDRFRDLQKYLHFVDNDTLVPRGQRGHDRLGKVRPVLDYVTAKCREVYMPQREVAVDEAMIKFQGRSSLKQYMPLKPIKRGIKGRLTDRSKRSISGFSLAGQKSCDGNVYQLPRPYTGIDGEQTALRRLKD